MRKFAVGFFRGDTYLYGKKFDLNTDGIKDAAIEMNLWERSNKSDSVSIDTFHTSVVIETEIVKEDEF